MMQSIEDDGKIGDFLAIVGRRDLDDELTQVRYARTCLFHGGVRWICCSMADLKDFSD